MECWLQRPGWNGVGEMELNGFILPILRPFYGGEGVASEDEIRCVRGCRGLLEKQDMA